MPPQTHSRRPPTALALLGGVILLLGAAASAQATPLLTEQALTANAAFLGYAPPPPGPAGALCLVDTGVNPLPDTTPGVVSATALDGGTGADVDPLGHGTIDAAIAGGAGHGVLGAWPQLKIVSVRSTTVPSPGQEPDFAFDDYGRGIKQCLLPRTGVPGIKVIDLPLSSVIPPSPDQTAAFVNAVAQAHAQGVTIMAAAGNNPGPIELPASEPGVFAVGAGETVGAPFADDSPNQICAFSATVGLTFFAPGCGVEQINPITDAPFCCGRGTSQASAFTAAIIVALRSYAPALTADQAAQILLSTTSTGHLDVTAAFRAAGLGSIVDAGNAAIPKPPPPVSAPPPAPVASQPPAKPLAAAVGTPVVKTASWRRGILRVALVSLPAGEQLHVKVTFAHHKPRYYATAHPTLHRRTPRPRQVLIHLTKGATVGATVSVKL